MIRVGALLLALTFSTSAHAAMMHHHDLASLAFLSDAVIKVERQGAFDRVTRVRITEVYRGSLRAGTNMDLPTSIYRLSGSLGGPSIDPGRTMIVFLTQRNGAWTITPSGLRVLDPHGHVQRFVQISNPGPYGVTPQGPDPHDVRDESRRFPPVDLATFEGMLRRAIRRADDVKAALELTDLGARRAAVLRLLPAPRSYFFASNPIFFYNDALADKAARVLGDAGDVRGTLEVWSRMYGDRVWSRSVLSNHTTELLAIGTNPSEPEHLRATALRTVFDAGELPTEPQARSILELLDDGSPEVRAAALAGLDYPGRVQSSDPGWPATQRRIRRLVSEALHGHWGREGSPAVRVQMLLSRETWRVRPRRVGRFAFATRREGDVLTHRWARRDNGPGVRVEVSSGTTVCASNPDRVSAWHSGTSGGGNIVPVACPRPWTVVARDADREVARITVE